MWQEIIYQAVHEGNFSFFVLVIFSIHFVYDIWKDSKKPD